jgi:hypothetical protein
MPNLAPLVSKLSVDPRSFISGLDQAQARLSAFTGTLAKGFTAFGSGNSMGVFTDPIKSALTALPGGNLAASALGTGERAMGMWKDQASGIVEVQKRAEALGVSYNFIKSLPEEAAHALGHLGRELGNAATGSQEAMTKFRGLGFSLEETSKLASGKLDVAFGAIADKVQSAGTAAEKQRIAFAAFGKSGQDLVGILSKGSAGLEEFRSRLDATGQAMSDEEARAVRLASQHLKLAEARISGIKDKFTVAAAPTVSAIAENPLSAVALTLGQLLPGENRVSAMIEAHKAELYSSANKLAKDPAASVDVAMLEGVEKLNSSLATQRDRFGQAENALTRFMAQFPKATAAQLDLARAEQAGIDRMNAITDANNGGITSLDKYQIAIKKRDAQLRVGPDTDDRLRVTNKLDTDLSKNLLNDSFKVIADTTSPLQKAQKDFDKNGIKLSRRFLA